MALLNINKRLGHYTTVPSGIVCDGTKRGDIKPIMRVIMRSNTRGYSYGRDNVLQGQHLQKKICGCEILCQQHTHSGCI